MATRVSLRLCAKDGQTIRNADRLALLASLYFRARSKHFNLESFNVNSTLSTSNATLHLVFRHAHRHVHSNLASLPPPLPQSHSLPIHLSIGLRLPTTQSRSRCADLCLGRRRRPPLVRNHRPQTLVERAVLVRMTRTPSPLKHYGQRHPCLTSVPSRAT